MHRRADRGSESESQPQKGESWRRDGERRTAFREHDLVDGLRIQLDGLFDRVSVAVNPTRSGSGFQIKLLYAIVRGVPVVSTAFSNRLGDAIPSSDDPRTMAALINERLIPGTVPTFDYAAFHREATDAWDRFLFGNEGSGVRA